MSDSIDNLVFLNQNIRSLRQNFDLFLSELSNLNISPDFIILTEVWISTDEINFYNINGYNVFRVCNDNYRSGGVVVYAKSRYQCNEIRQSVDDGPIRSADCLQLRCSYDDVEFIILAVYRLHSVTIAEFLDDIDKLFISLKGNNLIFTGDINCNILTDDNDSTSYLSLMAGHGLRCLINEPTRVVGNSQSCLDHCFIRFNERKFNLDFKAQVLHIGITDHSMILLELDIEKNVNIKSSNNEYSSIVDLNKLDMELQQLQWDNVLAENSVSTAFDLFLESLLNVIDKCKFNNSRESKELVKLTPWVSDYLCRGIYKRKKIYKLMSARPYDVRLKEYYRSFRNRLKLNLRKAKEEFYL